MNIDGKSYIRITGNNIKFKLPAFHHCDITFLNPVRVQSYGVGRNPESTATNENLVIPIKSTNVGRDVTVLNVDNPYQMQTEFVSGSNRPYFVVIYSTATLGSDIVGVSIDGEQINLRLFSKNQLTVKGEFIRFRYIRKDLAEFLFRMNDPISNWILTFMFFGCVLLSVKLVDMEIRAYFWSNSRFEKNLERFLSNKDLHSKKQCQEAFDKNNAHWAEWDSRFRFLQAVGPAMGFILTVSSLIEALHPTLLNTNDLDTFIKGIHVAMISTFLGLLVRIIAIEASRINDKLFARADMYLEKVKFNLNSDSPQTSPIAPV